MKLERLPIKKLKLDERNARKHGQRNLAAIKRSLEEFGQQKPIVVGRGNVVIAGNGTLAAAQELGWTEVAAVRTRLSGSAAVAYALADNRTSDLAEWEQEQLAELLRELRADEGIDELSTGFSREEIDTILGELEADEAADESEKLKDKFQVLVICDDESQQADLLERLGKEGYECWSLIS